VGDEKVQLAVAIIINERAPRAPRLAIPGYTCRRRNFLAGSISLVVVEPVFTVVGHVEVIESVVVIVPYAGHLSPPGQVKHSSAADIRKRAIGIVAKQVARWRIFRAGSVEAGTIHQKNIRPSIVVVVKNRHPAASRFYNVFLGVSSTVDVFHTQPG